VSPLASSQAKNVHHGLPIWTIQSTHAQAHSQGFKTIFPQFQSVIAPQAVIIKLPPFHVTFHEVPAVNKKSHQFQLSRAFQEKIFTFHQLYPLAAFHADNQIAHGQSSVSSAHPTPSQAQAFHNTEAHHCTLNHQFVLVHVVLSKVSRAFHQKEPQSLN
jgi:hypothetical protein